MFKPEAINEFKIRPGKHFILSWMRKWGWSIQDIINALQEAYKVEKVGKYKYEAFVRRNKKSRKIIFIVDEKYKEISVITGTEGK